MSPSALHDLDMCFLYAESNPTQSVAYGRKALEALVQFIGRTFDITLSGDNLSNHISQLESGKAIHSRIKVRMDSVRTFGNMASHHGSMLDEFDSNRCAADLLYIVNWLVDRAAAFTLEGGVLSGPLTAGLRLLEKKIEAATEEQKAVLDTLKNHRRVIVSGCAGSGKTLLAMEKASRLDSAGLSVLLLCHNPYLATSIEDALIYTDVRVSTFLEYLRSISAVETDQPDWDHYAEASSDDIHRALSKISQAKIEFDAVIVDEAQDFRDDWWLVVEELVRSGSGFLYIFSDNNQALLPARANYPTVNYSHMLSMNVRNSSEIAGAVARLNRIPITIRPELTGGTMRVQKFDKGGEMAAVTNAISTIAAAGLLDKSVVVTTEVVDPRYSALSDLIVEVIPSWSWQEAVRAAFPRLNPLAGRTRAPSSPRPRNAFPGLSDAPYPSPQDVDAIAKWARALVNGMNLKTSYVEGSVWLNVFSDRVEFAGLQSPMNIAHFLGKGRWAEQLPPPVSVTLLAAGNAQKGRCIPLHSAASIKGLEADGVITFIPTVVTDLKAHAYVALSRARLHQEVLILQEVERHLPKFVMK